jgi:hypothetical protein
LRVGGAGVKASGVFPLSALLSAPEAVNNGRLSYGEAVMPLRFTREDKSIRWIFLEAINDAGTRVLVKVSLEAMRRYGLEVAREAAQRKYAYRQFEADGAILILSIDCAGPHTSKNRRDVVENCA